MEGPNLSMNAPKKLVRGAAAPGEQSATLAAVIILIVGAVLLRELQWILLPFVVAGVIAFVLTPSIDWLARRMHKPRILFALAVFFLLLAFVSGSAFWAAPSLMEEFLHVIDDMQHIINVLLSGIAHKSQITWLGHQTTTDQVAKSAVESLRAWVGTPERIALFSSAAFGVTFGTVLTLVLLLYFLIGGSTLLQRLIFVFPPVQRPVVNEIGLRAAPLLRRYFVGVIAVVIYASLAAYIGLGVALRLPHAGFLAVLTGFLEIVPVVGPAASAAIAGLVAVHSAKSLGAIFAYALYATALRLSIDQLIGPLILGASARLHPALIIFCFLVGGALFGIIGVIMAVPFALIFKTALAVIYGDEPAHEAA